jgi:thioredoxin reductase (NADPH)
MYDVVVIGAGPAGLTSAIYLARANKKVLVLEALTYGGQIINTHRIDNYPALPHVSGIDFATNLYNQAVELGAEVVFEKAIDIDYEKKIVKTDKNEYSCKAIIIATGSKFKKLELDREEEFIGKGVSFCATCDGMFFKNKDVAVVGGGDTALVDTDYLSNIANKVYLIHRRDEFRGAASLLDELKKKNNIEFILNTKVNKLLGDKLLEGIEVVNDKGEERTINISGLFIAVGSIPESNNLVKDLDKDNYGYIKALEDTKTNIDGIFVAGDVRTKELRQLTTACADGSNAAIAAINYMNNKKSS